MAGKKGRSFADVASYVRRRANVSIARLKEVIAKTSSPLAQKGAEKRIERLETLISGTYLRDSNGKKLKAPTPEISQNVQHLAKEIQSTRYASKVGQRSLAATQRQLNMASAGDTASIYTESDVRIFYRATQRLWEGHPVSERNKVILEKTGYERLSDLVADVLAANEVARNKAENYRNLTKEQREQMDEEPDVKEAEQSPDYLLEVIQLEDNSGLYEVTEE